MIILGMRTVWRSLVEEMDGMTCVAVSSYHGFVRVKIYHEAIQVCLSVYVSEFFYLIVECITCFHIHVHLLAQISFASVDELYNHFMCSL